LTKKLTKLVEKTNKINTDQITW